MSIAIFFPWFAGQLNWCKWSRSSYGYLITELAVNTGSNDRMYKFVQLWPPEQFTQSLLGTDYALVSLMCQVNHWHIMKQEQLVNLSLSLSMNHELTSHVVPESMEQGSQADLVCIWANLFEYGCAVVTVLGRFHWQT
ncbi:hypothetical protein GOODEAATRI_015636 [Goodea atripinnis]|uniref:Uncharacterized protein n=1 Tax=Goodea atripinnis TaxID=208336 RepID=A0ABV0N1T1_9TELE